MLRSLLIIIAFLFTSLQITNAQFQFKPEDRLKNLQERLNLSKEQSVKVEGILKKAGEKMNNLPDDRTERWQKVRSIMDETNKEIEKILNKKQVKEFNKMLEERRNRMQGNRPQREQ
jgi:protein CpxP